MRRTRNADEYSLIEWNMNSTLQLHRLAQEKAGFGDWKCRSSVPITTNGEHLRILNLADLMHPTLQSIPVSDNKEIHVKMASVDDHTVGRILGENNLQILGTRKPP
jgi:hypothetical protein